MNEFDSTLIETLERLSPQPSRYPDWADVLDRAGIARRRGAAQARRSWRLIAAACVAGGVAALALAWPFSGNPDVVAQALAAIGSGRVTHAVLETSLGSSLVDLNTGTRTQIHDQTNIWYDPKLGLIETSSFNGSLLYTIRLSARAALEDGDTSRGLISGYRAALKSGSYHLVGSDTLAGTPIYWIESKPSYVGGGRLPGPIRTLVQQVAISRSTYEPLYLRTLLDGRVQQGNAARVISITTGPPNQSLFARTRTHFPNYGYTYSSPSTTLGRAKTAMHRQPRIPPTNLGGMRRTWIGQPRYNFGKTLQNANQFPAGVEFYYGKLDDTGEPVYTGTSNFISITEYPTNNAVVQAIGETRFPGNARALLQGNHATLKTHNLYVIIDAGTSAAAIAAARALAHG
jgi:hypothetical protein